MNLPADAFPVFGRDPNQEFPSPQLHPSRNKLQLGIRIGKGGQPSVLSVGPCSVYRAAYISGKHNPDSALAGVDSIKIQRQLC